MGWMLLALLAADEILWVEGERPASNTFQRHPWYDDVTKDVLSGKDWLSHFGEKPAEASYAIEVKEGGEYAFWVRCNHFKVTQHYRIDGGEWVACDLASEPREEMLISAKPDLRFLSWNKLGKVRLAAGAHTVSFRLTSANRHHGAIDCFVLAKGPFVPTGARKPGSAPPPGPEDWFEVMPDDDPFSAESAIDVSHLLHKPAGKFGFVRRKEAALVLDGKPVKFWGCGANLPPGKPRAWQEQWARYLAKHGVNIVRQHTVQEALGPLGKDGFDRARLDAWDGWFATLKKHGIYMTWSIGYPHAVRRAEGYDLFDELPPLHGNPDLRSTSGVVALEPALQESEWSYVKALLLHTNPYTGLRYVDEPALAVLEIHNEDSIFWHAPLNDLASGKAYPRHAARLKARWAEWLKKRYGTDEKLREAWGRGARPGDSLANAALGIYGAWEMGGDGPALRKEEARRMGDFIRFLAETQRAYYAERERRLREIGFKAVTVTTAWRAGGAAADPANLWCDEAMDMIDRHNYFGGGAGGHGIKEGEVHNESHLGQPGGGLLGIGLYQVEDRPFSVSEWTQLPPNMWKAEAAPLVAFYGMALQGWDVSIHFLSSRNRLGAGWPNLSSYVTDTPHYMGQFPALAFALQKGHLKEAPLASARRVAVEDLFGGKDALKQDFGGGGYDAKSVRGELGTPLEALAIGRVTARFGAPAGAEKADWAAAWDRERKVVTSLTGELRWDYGRRIVSVAAPKTQGVIGFAGGTVQDLPGVRVEVATPFVSLLFTPLDDAPLVSSRRILVTAMARDKQAGTEYAADGSRLLKAGGPPLLLEPVRARLTFKGTAPAEVRALDLYGVPTGQKVPVEAGAFSIDGRYRACYYEVRR